MKKFYLFIILHVLLASCVSVQDSKEYIDLSYKYDRLNKKYELISDVTKEELVEKVAKLENNNMVLSQDKDVTAKKLFELEAENKSLQKSLDIANKESANAKKLFQNYVLSTEKYKLAGLYMSNNGWEDVSLSTVKRLELDYTIKEVVYVKFNTGLGLYDGWYELGIFANSFNMPRQSFGKYSILGITIIGNDGSELQLDECRECTSH